MIFVRLFNKSYNFAKRFDGKVLAYYKKANEKLDDAQEIAFVCNRLNTKYNNIKFYKFYKIDLI